MRKFFGEGAPRSNIFARINYPAPGIFDPSVTQINSAPLYPGRIALLRSMPDTPLPVKILQPTQNIPLNINGVQLNSLVSPNNMVIPQTLLPSGIHNTCMFSSHLF